MNVIITIDTGTTNTRVTLWQDDRAIQTKTAGIGVRNTAVTGNNQELKGCLKQAIDELLSGNQFVSRQDVVILASGMITSNLGLVEIPHLTAPVGIDELAAGMQAVNIPEVFEKPIWFIPGVKNRDHDLVPERITDMDVIRGEEVEAIAAMNLLEISGPTVLVLPGSHTKMIKINAHKQIVGSLTSMTGELLDLLTKQSILADSLDEKFATEIDPEMIILGAKTAKQNGLGRTAFSVRLLDMYTNKSRNQRANYLLGAVLETDLQALKATTAFKFEDDPFIILGKPGLRDALRLLIETDEELTGDVIVDQVEHLSGSGAIQIAKARKLVKIKNV